MGGFVAGLLYLGFIVVLIVALWKIFTKAGKPGWASIVPFYNIIVLLEIVGRPLWWFVMLLIPLVNIVFAFLLAIDLAKSFGKGIGFAMGLIFLSPIFYPILGFGGARYQGPAAATA
ncbi:MAG: signal peptidase I [Verrucomicrobiaceae bacterium]|nr:signal peptidase I [Verrucomicrobiaceae bacterium]